MNNFKKKNKFISNKYNDEINNNIQIKSINGFECIGPCYPPNVVFYNPITLIGIKSSQPTCPIKSQTIINKNNKKEKILADKCNIENIDKNYMSFDIFNDTVRIATTDYMFLNQIYNITNINDVVNFISNSFDVLPIYTQRRLLNSIFITYYKYIEFPKKIFIQKLSFILENIYKIKNLNNNKIFEDLDNINNNSIDLYIYFYDKYNN